MPDVHQLLRVGISSQLLPVGDHLSGEKLTDAGQRHKGRRVRRIDVDLGNVNVLLKPSEHGILHDVGFGEVAPASEPSAFLPVVVNGLRLLLGESQAHEIVNADSVRIEAETLVLSWSVVSSDLLGQRRVLRVPAE